MAKDSGLRKQTITYVDFVEKLTELPQKHSREKKFPFILYIIFHLHELIMKSYVNSYSV